MTTLSLLSPGCRRLILAGAILAVLAPAAEAQMLRVRGELIINPRVTTPVDVIVEIRDLANQPIKQIIVDRDSPYRFNAFLPDGITTDLQVIVIVNVPKGYVSWQTAYVKRACCEFNEKIILKRPPDALVEMLAMAQKSSPDEAVELLEGAAAHAQTLAQTLEVQRQLGRVYLAQGMFGKQQEALKAVYAHDDAETLTPARKQAYWGERLDGLLLWSDYNNLPQPAIDFGKGFTETSGDPRLAGWQSFLADFNRAYPNSRLDAAATDPATIAEQLRTINRTIKRPFEQ